MDGEPGLSGTYATIAQAETAIQMAGYKRDKSRAVWVNDANKRCKVVYIESGKFGVQRA